MSVIVVSLPSSLIVIEYIERKCCKFIKICEECDELETVPHILIDCLKYVRERRVLINYFNTINTRLTAFNLLQDNSQTFRLLLQYLKDTDLISHI